MSISDHAFSLLERETELRGMLRTLGVTNWRPNGPHVGYKFQAPLQEPTAILEVQALVRQMLLDGESIPDDVARPIIDARAADALAKAREGAIIGVLDAAGGDAESEAGDEGIAPALAYLRVELARVMDAARTHVPDLAGIRTAADVLDASPDAVAAWRALRDLAEEYDEIRRTHMHLFRKAWVAENPDQAFTTAVFAQVGVYADFIDQHEHWTSLRRTAAANSWPGEYKDWLGKTTRPKLGNIDELDSPLRLVAIATHSTPWLPNVHEFIAARQFATMAIRAIDDENLKRAEHARMQLFTITGQSTEGLPAGDERPKTSARKARPKPLPASMQPETEWARQQREALKPSTWGSEQPW